jgi:hypothetical protein
MHWKLSGFYVRIVTCEIGKPGSIHTKEFEPRQNTFNPIAVNALCEIDALCSTQKLSCQGPISRELTMMQLSLPHAFGNVIETSQELINT